MILTYCYQNQNYDAEKTKSEILETVYAHNKAWSVLEDLDEQKKYVHQDVIFISPPYKEIKKGIQQYLADYKMWMDHATVHHLKEVNPDIKLYNDGLFAIVTYEIDMAFDYDDAKFPEWHGIDQMTLVNENGKWMITSDMYARHKADEE